MGMQKAARGKCISLWTVIWWNKQANKRGRRRKQSFRRPTCREPPRRGGRGIGGGLLLVFNMLSLIVMRVLLGSFGTNPI